MTAFSLMILGSLSSSGPFVWIGYLLAGIFLKKFWIAISAGLLVGLTHHIMMVMPTNQVGTQGVYPASLLAIVTGALIVTTIIWYLARDGRLFNAK
jgi:hypothetical protein